MDFSNRQNRFVQLHDAPSDYIKAIYESTQYDPFYPVYHIAPKHGLVNDPNGLYELNGEHHIFYQWFPLGPVHGLKHWYHVSTKDFITYHDHGVALYPDQDYDEHGCFSGSTFVENNQASIFYTANKMVDGVAVQTQVLASTDGNGVKKLGVIVNNQETHPTHEFRDPIVYKKDNEYIMLVGAQNLNEEAALELYRGPDFKQLKYCGNVSFSKKSVGFMLECPNYYEEAGQGVFVFSPQGLSSESKYDYKNVFSVVYAVGNEIDLDTLEFSHQGFVELDKGFDFYAPQIYQDESGRRLMYGWLGNSKSVYPTDKNGWAHMLTLPRELQVKDGIIYQSVIDEMNALKQEQLDVTSSMTLPSRQFKLELEVAKTFNISFENEQGDSIVFSGTKDEFKLDRSKMTHMYATDFGTERFAKRRLGAQKIELWFDHSSLEIFCDNGATVFTTRVFIDELSQLKVEGVVGTLHVLDAIKIPYKLVR